MKGESPMLSELEVKTKLLNDLKRIKDKNKEEINKFYNLLTGRKDVYKGNTYRHKLGFIVERIG